MKRRRFLVLAGVAGWTVLSGCRPPEGVVAPRAEGLADPDRRRVAEAIISTFENSTTSLPYAAAHRLDDGRGITAGRAGFTSGTHDLLLVMRRYEQMAGTANPLHRYLEPLTVIDTAVADGGDGSDTNGLKGFEDVWSSTSRTDPRLNAAQDAIYDQLYFRPAMDRAGRVGLITALGQLIILDTAVQHGLGSPDGLDALLARTEQKRGRATDDASWLATFLKVRRADLENPMDDETAEVWRESVPRVDTLESLLQQQRFDLATPIAWTFAGGRFSFPI